MRVGCWCGAGASSCNALDQWHAPRLPAARLLALPSKHTWLSVGAPPVCRCATLFCRYAQVLEALQTAGFLMASEMPQYLKVLQWRYLHLRQRYCVCTALLCCVPPSRPPQLADADVPAPFNPFKFHRPFRCVRPQERAEADGEQRPTKPDCSSLLPTH